MNNKIKKLFTSTVFRKILQINDKSIGSILTLHRINQIDPNKILFNEHLKISPEFLEILIKRFRKEKFSFVSIDELFDVLTKKIAAKKLLVFTLDDGYRDNYENALSIFKQHSVPFIIYISTSFPEKQMIFWWYLLEDIILNNDRIVLNNGEAFLCKHLKEKEAAFIAIRGKIISLNPINYHETLPELFSNYSFETKKYNDTLPLSWDQIKKLASEQLVTIGGHTHSHIALKYCTEKQIIEDIGYSNELFEKYLGKTPEHFCYPYGDSFSISPVETSMIAKMGVKTAVTTEYGNIYKSHVSLLHCLPRIFVTENQQPDLISTLTWMKFKKQ
jgi:peptidoglycan/xylan/chitin deacetylase (PgdA/CDA1 family)